MKRILRGLTPAVLLVLAFPAYAQGVKIPDKVPYADPGSVREAIRNECDLEAHMGRFLADAAKGQVEVVKGKADQAKGRVFDVKITGVWAAGGPYGAASVLVEGQLKEGGKVVGTVAARRNTTRGGGACSKLHVSARAVAKDLAGWLKNPVMDAKLGDAK
jgi:hypothetical protein